MYRNVHTGITFVHAYYDRINNNKNEDIADTSRQLLSSYLKYDSIGHCSTAGRALLVTPCTEAHYFHSCSTQHTATYI